MTRITGTLHRDAGTFILSRSFLLKWEIFKKKIVEKIENHNTHSTFSNFFFSPENLAVCEIVWKNMVESDRLQTT